MPIEVLMPALSPTMTEGNLAKWHKKVGEKVKAGDVIAEIETDKATMEVEAVDEGKIGQIIVPEDPDFVLPIGKAKIERPGKDVTIVAFSIMVGKALQAADELAKQGIDAEVINLRSLRPFDTETIVASVKKTNRLVSVEEGWPFAGIGSELAALMMEHAFDWLDAPVKRVHGLDIPLPYAANLEKMALPQVDNIVQAAREVCNR